MKRIVPPFRAQINDTPTKTPPLLTYRQGPLLTQVEICTIFWGVAWKQNSLSSIIQGINQFFVDVLASSYITQLQEYDVPGQAITNGQLTDSLTMVSPNLPSSFLGYTLIFDNAIQKALQDAIDQHVVPEPSANRLYFMFLPPKSVIVKGNQVSGIHFSGYHEQINNKIFYAVVPYPSWPMNVGNLSPLDAMKSISSHELCEAITDPIPGQGWYDDANGEIGDMCAWNNKQVNGHVVQKEWSNQQNQCV